MRTCAHLGMVLVGGLAASAWGGSVVYDNSTNGSNFYYPSPAEIGDPVGLAGTDRYVTNINLILSALDGDATADARVRLYAGGMSGEPGAMLWDSGVLGGLSFAEGTSGYDFVVPSVLVPDEITWTLTLSNVTGTLGLTVFGPATVGDSIDQFWAYDHPDYPAFPGWVGLYFPFTYSSFGATITADPVGGVLIPLPAPALRATAGLGLVVVRRRR